MAIAQEHHVPITRTARYYQLGKLGPATRRVWFVCHGYGQLAEFFIRYFAFLPDQDPTAVVIAPEALSRFYLKGDNGRVGASWMTRADRLSEIEDYVAYLNQLSESILATCSPDVAVTVLGFSQGSATISRWLLRAHFRPVRLILWAGAFPPDMELEEAARLLQQVPVTLVCGRQDEYLSTEAVDQQFSFLRDLNVEPTVIWFDGRHQLDTKVLREIVKSEE